MTPPEIIRIDQWFLRKPSEQMRYRVIFPVNQCKAAEAHLEANRKDLEGLGWRKVASEQKVFASRDSAFTGDNFPFPSVADSNPSVASFFRRLVDFLVSFRRS